VHDSVCEHTAGSGKGRDQVRLSVFKWGKQRAGLGRYDYTKAHSNVVPWWVDLDDINKKSSDGKHVLEVPIYAERASVLTMINKRRIVLRERMADTRPGIDTEDRRSVLSYLRLAFSLHPKNLTSASLVSPR